MPTIVFVSNYINHHQMPFCDEMYRQLGDSFSFIQVQPMEESRVNMGWSVDEGRIPYLHRMYEPGESDDCASLIQNSDVMMLGWTGLAEGSREDEVIRGRLSDGRPVIRVSERIYREGRWKAISPRGLISKYKEHIRFKNDPVYMLCAGAFVSGDFKMLGAYPGKLLKWGYFPPLKRYSEEEIEGMLYRDGEVLRLCFAGRLIKLKHPEFVIYAALALRGKGVSFHIDVLGDGPLRRELETMAEANGLRVESVGNRLEANGLDYGNARTTTDKSGLDAEVSFHGALPPDKVRTVMEKSHISIFSSNYLEGWGAVVNEAMNSACAVIASHEAGAVPYLIQDGVNGVSYDHCSRKEFEDKLMALVDDTDALRSIQREAYRTIADTWNAEVAAGRLIEMCRFLAGDVSDMKGQKSEEHEGDFVDDDEICGPTAYFVAYSCPADGPLSHAEVIKAPGFSRTMQEDNHLE